MVSLHEGLADAKDTTRTRPSTIDHEMSTEQDAYDELCSYTLTHGDPTFIHQHVVDAIGAQRATSDTKPVRLTFSLVGLLLHVEWKWTGREVQRAHMRLAARRRDWPRFALPDIAGRSRRPMSSRFHQGPSETARSMRGAVRSGRRTLRCTGRSKRC